MILYSVAARSRSPPGYFFFFARLLKAAFRTGFGWLILICSPSFRFVFDLRYYIFKD